MRITSLSFLAVLMMGSSCAWAAATPMDAPLKEDGITTIECNVVDKNEAATAFKPWVQDNSKKTEGYHYKLYLPKGYQQNKDYRYPCMFISSPGGNAPLANCPERYKRDEWVVVMLVESSNESEDALNNFLAAYDDVVKRVRIAKGAKFATGFSGGARCSSWWALVRPGMAGVICQAAGFIYNTDFKVPPYCPKCYLWYPPHILVAGTFGDGDGNIKEAHEIRRDLSSSRVNILLFKGGHDWCPREVFESSLDWMEDALFVNPQPAPPLPHRPPMGKVFPPEPPDADAYRWYLRKCTRLLDEAKEGPARYLALTRILAVVEKGKLAADKDKDKDIIESVKKWQTELDALKATAPIKEFENKALAAYRNARTAEDAYARQMKLEKTDLSSDKMPLSPDDRQALDRTRAAYRVAVKDYPDSPFAAECGLKVAALEIEIGKSGKSGKPDVNQQRVTSVVDGGTFVVSPGWGFQGQTGTIVRVAGYAVPELNAPGGAVAKAKLEQLILGKQVGLGNCYCVDRKGLACYVYLNGKNLADYFPEY